MSTLTMNPEPRSTTTDDAAIRIRRASRGDGAALERLRQLDSRRLPSGEIWVAEVGDRILAARSLETGEAISDPFSPTAHLRSLLAVRAATLAGAKPAPRRLALRLRRRYARAEAV
jgi:hypothetical protein